jgi:hypothetical protein
MKNIEQSKMRMKKFYVGALLLLLCMISTSVSGQLLKVGLAGLSHDHVNGIMRQYKNGEVLIVGIAESDQPLIERIKKRFQLPDSIFYKDLPAC